MMCAEKARCVIVVVTAEQLRAEKERGSSVVES